MKPLKAYIATARGIAMRVSRPRLYAAMKTLSQASVQKVQRQTARCADLEQLLAKHNPQTIVECGTGLSTIAFALYCEKSGATLLSLEQDADWLELMKAALVSADIDGYVPTLAPVVKDSDGIRYDFSIPKTDFLYVDGPSGAGDALCKDASLMLSSKQLPKVVVVDGRNATVDALAREAPSHVWVGGAGYTGCLPKRTAFHSIGTQT